MTTTTAAFPISVSSPPSDLGVAMQRHTYSAVGPSAHTVSQQERDCAPSKSNFRKLQRSGCLHKENRWTNCLIHALAVFFPPLDWGRKSHSRFWVSVSVLARTTLTSWFCCWDGRLGLLCFVLTPHLLASVNGHNDLARRWCLEVLWIREPCRLWAVWLSPLLFDLSMNVLPCQASEWVISIQHRLLHIEGSRVNEQCPAEGADHSRFLPDLCPSPRGW